MNTKIVDEFTGTCDGIADPIKRANKLYQKRRKRDKKSNKKCGRCPQDALIVTRVGVDGTVVKKVLSYCAEHQAYFSVFNKQARDKKRGMV